MMTISEITRLRLLNQHVTGAAFNDPADLLHWLCGIQGQDYTHAKWAIGARLPGITDADVERAIADASIVRTWPMRGTLHLVAATDVRWMLSLFSARLIKANASRDRQLQLDERTYARANEVIHRTLQGGYHGTRKELSDALTQAGIGTEEQRLSHILRRASLDQLICCGPRRAKEFTFTLLDEWAPVTSRFDRNESLCELARRYFSSRGPASFPDFVWWSGLPVSEARAALEMAAPQLEQVTIHGEKYWLPKQTLPSNHLNAPVLLLPGFDEYVIAYRDRSACVPQGHFTAVVHSNGIFQPVVVMDGQVTGIWKKSIQKNRFSIETTPFQPFNEHQQRDIEEAGKAYARFLGL